MSLRAFHIIFIIASVLLCLYVGLWYVRQNVVVGVLFFVAAAGLMIYGKKAFAKLRDVP
jgi:hypothetical protein